MTFFRIWSEYLPLDTAQKETVVSLLKTFNVHPIFAVRFDTDVAMLAKTIKAYQAVNLAPGVWPLMPDEDGYWPSEGNADAYFERVHALLASLEAYGVVPEWLAVDLEPPLKQVDALRHRGSPLHRTLASVARQNLDGAKFEQAVQQFQREVDKIHQKGIQTLSVALPLVAHDLRDNDPLWQDLFEAPWAPVQWHRLGIMAYGSMVAGYSRGWLSQEDARAMHYRLMVRVAHRFGKRAHVSLGVTGVGKLGDEPVYTNPGALALDVSAARSAGIEDIAIFCLEGLLAQSNPEAWLAQITSAQPIAPPMTLRARGARVGGWLGRKMIQRWSANWRT